MDNTKFHLTQVVQDYLNTKFNNGLTDCQCIEECIYAVDVSLVNEWVNQHRIAAIITNTLTNQSVFFIFIGRLTDDSVVLYLTATHMINMDSSFRIETDKKKPTCLKIIGANSCSQKQSMKTSPQSTLLSFESGLNEAILTASSTPNLSISQSPNSDVPLHSICLELNSKSTADFLAMQLGLELLTNKNVTQSEYSISTDWLDEYRMEVQNTFQANAEANVCLSRAHFCSDSDLYQLGAKAKSLSTSLKNAISSGGDKMHVENTGKSSFSSIGSELTTAQSHNFESTESLLNTTGSKNPKTAGFLPNTVYRRRLQTDGLVRRRLEECENDYCSFETVTVFVGSWNVNGKQDSHINLDSWFLPPSEQLPPDIFVFGFQELDLSLGGMALNKVTPSPLEFKWLQQIESALGGLLAQIPSTSEFIGAYHRLSIVRLSGLLLIVYVSKRMLKKASVSDIGIQFVPTGVFNVMGNKGAVGLRLTIFNSSICFVNCHLAAGVAYKDRRNQDYHEIMKKMIFDPRIEPNIIEQLTISQHDKIFLFGDLNYRIVGLDSVSSVAAIDRQDYQLLLKHDELLDQLASQRVLNGFNEGNINFPPTYKFDLNTQDYYLAEGRLPSYCDRILWKGRYCEQIAYRAHHEFTLSDHKPVAAFFKLGVRCVDANLFHKAYESVIRCHDFIYNMSLPQAELTSQEVEFGPVCFDEIRQDSITIKNTGLSSLEFKFTQEGTAIFPNWLTVTPMTSVVNKNASCVIVFDVFVNVDCVAQLQASSCDLSCIIVLTLVGGKDYFISVSGTFVPTCFGLPLSLLLKIPNIPVAQLPRDTLRQMIREAPHGNWKEQSASVIPNHEGAIFFTAKELYRMIQFLVLHLDEPNLFREPGQRSEFQLIRDTLDNTTYDVPIPENVSPHSVAYSLLIFLSVLPEPVIPYAFQPACLTASPILQSAITALSKIPIDYQNLFYYIISFLRQCLAHAKSNGTDLDMLATTFAEIIFRNPQLMNKISVKSNFVKIFLSMNYEEIVKMIPL